MLCPLIVAALVSLKEVSCMLYEQPIDDEQVNINGLHPPPRPRHYFDYAIKSPEVPLAQPYGAVRPYERDNSLSIVEGLLSRRPQFLARPSRQQVDLSSLLRQRSSRGCPDFINVPGSPVKVFNPGVHVNFVVGVPQAYKMDITEEPDGWKFITITAPEGTDAITLGSELGLSPSVRSSLNLTPEGTMQFPLKRPLNSQFEFAIPTRSRGPTELHPTGLYPGYLVPGGIGRPMRPPDGKFTLYEDGSGRLVRPSDEGLPWSPVPAAGMASRPIGPSETYIYGQIPRRMGIIPPKHSDLPQSQMPEITEEIIVPPKSYPDEQFDEPQLPETGAINTLSHPEGYANPPEPMPSRYQTPQLLSPTAKYPTQRKAVNEPYRESTYEIYSPSRSPTPEYGLQVDHKPELLETIDTYPITTKYHYPGQKRLPITPRTYQKSPEAQYPDSGTPLQPAAAGYSIVPRTPEIGFSSVPSTPSRQQLHPDGQYPEGRLEQPREKTPFSYLYPERVARPTDTRYFSSPQLPQTGSLTLDEPSINSHPNNQDYPRNKILRVVTQETITYPDNNQGSERPPGSVTLRYNKPHSQSPGVERFLQERPVSEGYQERAQPEGMASPGIEKYPNGQSPDGIEGFPQVIDSSKRYTDDFSSTTLRNQPHKHIIVPQRDIPGPQVLGLGRSHAPGETSTSGFDVRLPNFVRQLLKTYSTPGKNNPSLPGITASPQRTVSQRVYESYQPKIEYPSEGYYSSSNYPTNLANRPQRMELRSHSMNIQYPLIIKYSKPSYNVPFKVREPVAMNAVDYPEQKQGAPGDGAIPKIIIGPRRSHPSSPGYKRIVSWEEEIPEENKENIPDNVTNGLDGSQIGQPQTLYNGPYSPGNLPAGSSLLTETIPQHRSSTREIVRDETPTSGFYELPLTEGDINPGSPIITRYETSKTGPSNYGMTGPQAEPQGGQIRTVVMSGETLDNDRLHPGSLPLHSSGSTVITTYPNNFSHQVGRPSMRPENSMIMNPAIIPTTSRGIPSAISRIHYQNGPPTGPSGTYVSTPPMVMHSAPSTSYGDVPRGNVQSVISYSSPTIQYEKPRQSIEPPRQVSSPISPPVHSQADVQQVTAVRRLDVKN